jgi:hypothetical protein
MHSDGFPYGVGSMERTMGVCPENPSSYTQIDAHANQPCQGPAKSSGEPSAPSDAKKVERENLFIQKDTSADGLLSHPKYMSGQKDPEQAKERFIKFDTYGDR